MRRRTFVLAGIGLTAAGAISACKPKGEQKAPEAKAPLKDVTFAQWGQERYLIYLPVYLAQEAGLFAREGLNVKLTFSGNDDQVFAAVARGDAMFGIGDPIFAAISRNRGSDGVVVGQLVGKVALWGVAAKGAPRRDDPAAFADARIGSFPRPSTTYTLLKDMIGRNHVADARIIEVPIGSEVALLEARRADVVMMLEPAASQAAASGYDIVTSFPRLWGPFAFTGLTSTLAEAKANPTVVAGVRRGMQAALDLAHQHPDQAIAIARKLFPALDGAVVEAAVNRMLADETVPRSFAVDAAGWANAVGVRQAMGELKSGSDYADVVLP